MIIRIRLFILFRFSFLDVIATLRITYFSKSTINCSNLTYRRILQQKDLSGNEETEYREFEDNFFLKLEPLVGYNAFCDTIGYWLPNNDSLIEGRIIGLLVLLNIFDEKCFLYTLEDSTWILLPFHKGGNVYLKRES